jgi:hypothetical protein
LLLVDKFQLDTCSDYFQTATSIGNVKVCSSKHCSLTCGHLMTNILY